MQSYRGRKVYRYNLNREIYIIPGLMQSFEPLNNCVLVQHAGYDEQQLEIKLLFICSRMDSFASIFFRLYSK
jgi:hypothetical protein